MLAEVSVKSNYAKINKEIGQLLEADAESSRDISKYADAALYYENYLNVIKAEKKQSDFYFTNYKVGEIYSKLEGSESNIETVTKAINHFKISREYFNNEELLQELKVVDDHLTTLYDKLINIYHEEGNDSLVVEVARDSLSIFSKEKNPQAYANFSYRAGKNYYNMASRVNSKENYFNAISFLEESHSIFNDPKYGEYFGEVTRTLGSVYNELYKLENQDDYLIKSRDSYAESLRFYTPDNFITQNTEIEATIKGIKPYSCG